MTTNNGEPTASSAKMGRFEKIRRALTNMVGYLIPLVMSAPGLYASIMTMPFVAYLVLMFTSPGGVVYLFLGGSILENIVLMLGVAFFLYSVIFLWRTKPTGLVTRGPYRIVRHPQYLGLLLFTAVLTSRSIWVLLNTFGVGFLAPHETIAVWFIMALAYIGLAMFEERHLAGAYREEWHGFRERVGFLVPLIANKRRWVDIAVSLLFVAALISSLLFSNDTLWWFV